jgi:hypothetical protein
MRETLREGNLHDAADLLMAPYRSGIVLTRTFLVRAAHSLGLSGSSIIRKQYLENLFREAGRARVLPELILRIRDEARRWLAIYHRDARTCPGVKRALAHHRAQAKQLVRELGALATEARRLQVKGDA